MIVYVDVDETLVRSTAAGRVPVPAIIAHIRKLKTAGVELYLWSSGGADYCRRTAADLGITECFTNFLPKPHIIIDDQEVKDWPACTTVHPSKLTGSPPPDSLPPHE